MSARIVITGAGGFLGRHLVAELGRRWRVTGIGRSENPDPALPWIRVGRQGVSLADAVDGADLVVHAAFVNRKPARITTARYLADCQRADLEVFERCADRGCPVVLAGSSAVYGSGEPDVAMTERMPFEPRSPYGLAKAIQEMQARYFRRQYGMPLTVVRLFNLLGPGRGSGTVAHDWAAQLAAVHRGEAAPRLRVRHLVTSRDLVDPRDAARAFRLLADRLLSGAATANGEAFNVGSGKAVAIRRICAELLSLCRVPCEVDETAPWHEGAGVRTQQADIRKIGAECGWEPRIDWQQSVRDIWNQHVAQATG